jgi:hypothetical protein
MTTAHHAHPRPLAAALAYAAVGWPVLSLHTPVRGGGCSCRTAGCVTISRRNTPDFVTGSRNLTVASAQMLAPSLEAAHASARVSSILLANSGGVNTSSFERFAMHVS